MKQVISLKDLEEMARNGKDLSALPGDALLTPSARDFLSDLDGKTASRPAANDQSLKAPPAPPKTLSSKSPKPELEALFNSAYCQDLKEQICDIGKRLWSRAYVDGNGGNIAIRVGQDIALCTPTLVSKGS